MGTIRFSKLLSLILIVCFLSMACGLPQLGASPSAAPAPDDELSSAEASLPVETEGEAHFVDDLPALPAASLPALGSASFTVDLAHQTSGEFSANGEDLELQLTDAAGLTWHLHIPALALGAPHTIQMTALTNLSSPNIPGSLAGGVLLEPDGLQLDLPATLTVSGAALQGQTLILGGTQDGSKLDFTLPAEPSTGTSASILHFSSYTAADLNDAEINSLLQAARQQYKELSLQARQLLKEKNIPVPRPPAVPMRCTENEETQQNQASLQDFATQFLDPEYALVTRLLAAQRNLQLLGEAGDLTLEVRLLERLLQKTELLIREYGGNIEHLPAISQVTLTVIRGYQLLGGESAGRASALMTELAQMYERATQKLLDELVNQHEYRNIDALLNAHRAAALLGQDVDTGKLLSQIENALVFDLQLTYTAQLTGTQDWELKAAFPVKPVSALSLQTLQGSGTGSLVSYSNSMWPELICEASSFNVEATLHDFKPCEGTIQLSLDQFHPPAEKYIDPTDEDPEIATMPLTQTMWQALFEQYAGEGGYTFPLQLNNQNVNAVDQTVEGVALHSQGNTLGNLHVKLTHTPRGQ